MSTYFRDRTLELYTIGQRQGLGIASNIPVYVTGIDRPINRLIVGGETALWRHRVRIDDLNWIAGARPADTNGLSARIRYRMPDASLTSIEPDGGENAALLTFAVPVRAVTPGQSLVIYRCEEVLGGGIITG